MALGLADPLQIVYGGFVVGGDTPYLIDGAHTVSRTNERLEIGCDVVVTADDPEQLIERCAALEAAYTRRDQGVTIAVGNAGWTYGHGTGILNSSASVLKAGRLETDRPLSRGYTLSVSGTLPADDSGGLRELQVDVELTDARQYLVTLSGLVTASGGELASARYADILENEARGVLDLVSTRPSWELIAESSQKDRLDHELRFSATYVELLYDQSELGRNDRVVKNHRVTFHEATPSDGDGLPNITRLRQVVAVFECALDLQQVLENGSDPQTPLELWERKIQPHLRSSFEREFSPKVFAATFTDPRFDFTSARLTAQVVFTYQPEGTEAEVVEVEQSLTYVEHHAIRYTPLLTGELYHMVTDPGFAERRRVWRRRVMVLGAEFPKTRIGVEPKPGPAGLFDQGLAEFPGEVLDRGQNAVVAEGWNIEDNTSTVENKWLGNAADGSQVLMSILTETVVERYVEDPGDRYARGPA